jgi:hypothetical protein
MRGGKGVVQLGQHMLVFLFLQSTLKILSSFLIIIPLRKAVTCLHYEFSIKLVQDKESQSECRYELRSGVKQTCATIAVEIDGTSAYCEVRS